MLFHTPCVCWVIFYFCGSLSVLLVVGRMNEDEFGQSMQHKEEDGENFCVCFLRGFLLMGLHTADPS